MAPCSLALPSSVSALSSRVKIAGRATGAPRRACVLTRAEGGSGQDLDERWREFKKSAGAKTDRVTTEAPRFTSSRSSGWNASPSTDAMRRREQQLLDAWTQGRLMQLAAGGTMLLVLVLLFAAGGPPADPRCTLPWC